MDDAQINSTDMESGADSFTEPDMEEDSADAADDSSEDMIDPNEELVPIDEAPGMSADGNVEGIEWYWNWKAYIKNISRGKWRFQC